MSLGSTWSRSGQSFQGGNLHQGSLFGPRAGVGPRGRVGRGGQHGHGGHRGHGHRGHGHRGSGFGPGYVPYYGYGFGYAPLYGYGTGFGPGYGYGPGVSFASPWVNVQIDSARYGRVYSGSAGFPGTVYGNPYRGTATYSVVPYGGITVPPVVNGYNLSAPALPQGSIPIEQGVPLDQQNIPFEQNVEFDESIPLDQNPNAGPSLPIPQDLNDTAHEAAKVEAAPFDDRDVTGDDANDDRANAERNTTEPIASEFDAAASDRSVSTAADRLQGLRLQSRGDREFRSGDFDAALEHYQAAADMAKDRSAPWVRQTWCHVAQDDFPAAVATLKRALQTSDGSDLAWVEAADMFGSKQAAAEMVTDDRLWSWLDERRGSADRMLLVAAYQYFTGLPDAGGELLQLAEETGLPRSTADALRSATKNVESNVIEGVPLP